MSERARTSPAKAGSIKERIAYEAARIMIEQGLCDYDRVRRKAAERMGIPDRRQWPSNATIHDAVLTQRRLFFGHASERDCLDLREKALQAMYAFQDFLPRLIGSVLSGTGDRQTGIEFFLFADRPEDVLFSLMEQRIPWQEAERDFRYSDGQRHTHPVFRFVAGEIPFQLIVLPVRAQRNPPLDAVTDRPQRGADREEVERLLAHIDSAYRREIVK